MAGEADGVILVALGFPDRETEQIYEAARFPIVLVEGRRDWGGRVALDNVKAGRLAVEHLFSRGRRRLALANGDRRIFQSYAERQQGFMEAMKADPRAGDTPMPWESREARRPTAPGLRAQAKPLVFETDGVDIGAMDEIAQRLAEHRDHINGVFVATGDLYAIRLIQGLRRAGVRVPEDMAVLGVDDLAEAQAFGLSTIRQPFEQFGHKAVAMLLEMMEKKRSVQSKEWLAAPHLVLRATT